MDNEKEKGGTSSLGVPVAIVIAGALIAGALFWGWGGSAGVSDRAGAASGGQPIASLKGIRPVASSDHVLGDLSAPVKIVEYSDFECPFCKGFHATMQQIVEEYDGKVAWVYRHFPLDSIHSKARSEAVASECANELGGNEAFWKFTDRFFELTPSNNRTDTAVLLPQIAGEIGLDEAQFANCLVSGKYDDHVQADLDNAILTGGTGTPWSVVVGKDDQMFSISGAQPYTAVKQIVDLALE
jgi:protein-disulfide isomerase